MEIETAPILYTLLLTLAVALVAMMAAIVFVLIWRKRAEDTLNQMTGELSGFTDQSENINRIYQEYASLHRQPYAEMCQELLIQLNQINDEIQNFENMWGDLNNQHNSIPINRVKALVYAIPDAFDNKVLADTLWKASDGIRQRLTEANTLASRLNFVPSETAKQARVVGDEVKEVERLLHELHEAGLHGKNVEEADDTLLHLQQGWARIPTDFIAPGEPDEKILAVRETASQVFEILNDIQPILAEWLPRVQGWDGQYKQSVEAYEHLRKSAAHFRTALDVPPAILIIDGFRGELDKVRSTARGLNKRLTEPMVEDLRALERETNHMVRVVQEMAERYDLSVQQVAQLDQSLLELDAAIQKEAARMAEVEKHETSPLVWDASKSILADHSQKFRALGTRELRRTPEQVAEALAGASILLGQLKAFSARLDVVLANHQELLGLLESSDVQTGDTFLQQAQDLVHRVAVYDANNWNRQEEISTLGHDVAILADAHRRLIATDKPVAVKENILEKQLEETHQLADAHPAMRARVERVLNRLDEIQKAEADGISELSRAKDTLANLQLILKENPFLQGIASAEISRLSVEIEKILGELDTPIQGPVERKISRANSLLDGFSHTANQWLDKLAVNLTTYTHKMSETLAALDAVCSLDDREVNDARTLLARLGAAPVNRKSGLNYLDAAMELKRWNNDWQSCAAATAALEKLAQPVLETSREAEEARKAARAAFQQAGKLASGRRDWPPTRQALGDEVKNFQQLEGQLDGLHSKRMASAALVRELSQISRNLDQLDDRVNQSAHQAEEDQRAVVELEKQVETMQMRWQALAQRHSDQAAVSDGIKDLLSRTDTRLNYLKAQYKRGSLDYDAAVSSLQEMIDGLAAATFHTDDNQIVALPS